MAKDLDLLDVTPEFDYIKLKQLLSNFRSPRDKTTQLIEQGKIVRVKKGLYVLGTQFKKPYSTFILGNLIYGPSYISGVTALSHYGLIPERVEVISSTTPNRRKEFNTPVGHFIYDYLASDKYRVGIVRENIDDERAYLIASPEKAFVEHMLKFKSIHSVNLLEDWIKSTRIDLDVVSSFKLKSLAELQQAFRRPQIEWLIDLVRRLKK